MRRLSFLGALVLAACAAACSFVEATSVQYVGVPRFPAGEPASVQVLRAEPAQRHDRLGEVLLDISTDPPPPVEDIEQKLREEAARMGANAIYVIRDVARPGAERKLIGIAFRYRP
jgi:hypothetical protein